MAWDREALVALRETLARLYPREADIRRVLDDAGLDASVIEYDPKPATYWYLILRDAQLRSGRIEALIDVALADYPDNEALQRAKSGVPPPPVLAGPEPKWQGPGGPQLERIIGTESTLVPISYLEVGMARSRAVARIRLADGSSGTGFLTPDDLLVTNHHVLPDADVARTATAQFNYQETVGGLSAEVDEHALEPDGWFATSEADDWTAVRVKGEPGARWGHLELASSSVKAGDRVNIIQHPGGLPKKVSFYSNVVVYVGGNRVQYLTDTEPGSSGSPVFDKGWNVVAVHHSGGWLEEPGGNDPTRRFYRNEGILTDAVIAGIAAAKGAG